MSSPPRRAPHISLLSCRSLSSPTACTTLINVNADLPAKHRVAKDFVCPTCGKGFARKDILKRHEQGHAKQQAAAAEAAARGDYYDKGYDSPASHAGKGKKKRVSSIGDAAADDGSGPAKIARVGRACCRCSKSKCVMSPSSRSRTAS